jgi:pyruvate formate lyase activating enzyme
MKDSRISLDLSVLYRLNQRYYDNALSQYDLGYTQMIFILLIFENEGISFNNLAKAGSFDKGTVTKSIQKLEENGFVTVRVSDNDKRNKEVYTTDKCKQLVPQLYQIKNDWFNYVSEALSEEEKDVYVNASKKLIESALNREAYRGGEQELKIYRMDKSSFKAYEGYLSAILYVGGCPYRCPTCNFSHLVFLNEGVNSMPLEDITSFLKQRKDRLDAVVLKGSDPFAYADLDAFLRQLKRLGYKIKIHTDGHNYLKMKELCEEKLIDYLCLEIKNQPERYASSMGMNSMDLDDLNHSIEYLIKGKIDYDLTLVVSDDLIAEKDIVELAKWIKGAKRLYLVPYERSENAIDSKICGTSIETLNKYKKLLSDSIEEVIIRGEHVSG